MIKFFASLMSNIFVVILAGIVGVPTLIAWATGTLDFLIQYINIPTPLWTTIAGIVLCCLYIYLKVQKLDPSSSPKKLIPESQPIKYCECCPINEKQPLKRTGGTSKRSFYVCPKTNQSYSVPHVLEK
jgi:hypothetical protein